MVHICVCLRALKDANKVVSLASDWPKGYFRKGKALAGLKVSMHYYWPLHYSKSRTVLFVYWCLLEYSVFSLSLLDPAKMLGSYFFRKKIIPVTCYYQLHIVKR